MFVLSGMKRRRDSYQTSALHFIGAFLCAVVCLISPRAALAVQGGTYTNRAHNYTMQIPAGYRLMPMLIRSEINGSEDSFYVSRAGREVLDIAASEPGARYDENNNRIEFQNTPESFRDAARSAAMGTCARDGTEEGASCPRVVRESQMTTAGGLVAMEFYLQHVADLQGRRSIRTVFGPVYVVNISSPAHPQLLIIQPTSSDGRLVRREAIPAVRQLMRNITQSIRSLS